MKVLNDLLDYNNMKIYQDDEYFNFSLDSVLLANFVTLKTRVKNIIDLGTGNAPIPLIMTTRTDAKIYGLELQKEIYELAKESVSINNLDNKIELINDDIKNLRNHFEQGFFDVITCNPPYFKVSKDSNLNENEIKTNARHETKITLEEVISISKQMLNNNGVLALVHRTDRLIEIIDLMKKNNIEPKRIRFVYPKVGEESNLVLVEGRKNGNVGLKILPPLIAHENNGDYSKEVKEMFTTR